MKTSKLMTTRLLTKTPSMKNYTPMVMKKVAHQAKEVDLQGKAELSFQSKEAEKIFTSMRRITSTKIQTRSVEDLSTSSHSIRRFHPKLCKHLPLISFRLSSSLNFIRPKICRTLLALSTQQGQPLKER